MANNEQRKIEIIADGKKANASIKEMRATVSLLNNQLNKLPQGSKEFAEKSKEFKEVKARLNSVTQEAKGLESSFGDVVTQMVEMTPFGGILGGIQSKIGGVTGGVQGLSGGFKTLGRAIIASGIGALLFVLSQLYVYLTSTQDGMDKVTAYTRPLLAVFERLKGLAQELGKSVFKGLALILKGDLKEGLEVLKNGAVDAVKNVGAAVEEGWKVGKELDSMQKDIEEAEIKMIKRRKELERIAKQMNFIVEDETRSYDERRVAAEAALKAQEELQQIQLDLMDQRIEKMQKEHSLNDTSRVDEKALAELQAEREAIQASIIEMRTTTRNKLNTINKQEVAEHQKMLDEKQKAEEEYFKKVATADKSLQELRIAMMEDENEREIASLNLQYQRKMEEVQGGEAQIAEQKLLLEQDLHRKIDELQARREEDQAKKRQEKFEASLDMLDQEEELRQEKLTELYLNSIISEQERDQALLDLEKATLEQKLTMLTEAGLSETLEAQKIKNAILQIEQEKNDQILADAQRLEQQKEAIQQSGLEAVKGFTDLQIGFIQQETDERTAALDKKIELLSIDKESQEANAAEIARLQAEKEQIRKESARKTASIQVAQVIADGIREVASIWAGAATLGPIAGPIIGALQTGLAVGRTALAVRKIKSQTFAEGGFTSALSIDGRGKMVDQTGHAVAGVVHEKEWVSPKWMVENPKYANVIRWLESERTRRFAEGGYSSAPPQVKGEMGDSISSDMMTLLVQLNDNFKNYAGKVNNWAANLKVNNDPRDIQEGLQAINEMKNDSQIR